MSSPTPFVCRSCRRFFLRRSPPKPPTLLHQPQSQQQHHPFSTTSTPQKHGPLPTIYPTSTPRLHSLLTHFRTTVFLPAHLLTLQQNLIYRPKNIPLLTNPDEPATVRIGDEVLPLQPLNHLKDEPDTKKGFAEVLSLMTTSGEDWRNLPGFLEGLRTAKRRVERGMWEKVVRRAGMYGRVGVVMECARRVEGTGLGMGEVGVVREVGWGLVDKINAAEGGWEDKEVVDEVAKMVTSIWEMMGEKAHVKLRAEGAVDPRKAPEVLGVMLQILVAKTLLNPEASLMEKAEVEKFARRLLRASDTQPTSPPLVPSSTTSEPSSSSSSSPPKPTTPKAFASQTLLHNAPIWHSAKLARRLFIGNEELCQKLLDLQDRAEGIIQEAGRRLKDLKVKGTRGQKVWERLSEAEV